MDSANARSAAAGRVGRVPAAAAGAARQRAGRLRGSGAAKFAGAASAASPFRRASSSAADRARARLRAFRRSRRATPCTGTRLFEALQEHFHASDPSIWGWPVWPPEYRDPQSPARCPLRRVASGDIDFYEYLQWQADAAMLAAAESRVRARHVDRPVRRPRGLGRPRRRGGLGQPGPVRARCAASARRPTTFNPHGQDWGLPPLIPARLQRGRLCAVHRDAARQHAARRRAAHRPRDGHCCACSGSRAGCSRGTAPTCAIRSTTCWACSRWKATATSAW